MDSDWTTVEQQTDSECVSQNPLGERPAGVRRRRGWTTADEKSKEN